MPPEPVGRVPNRLAVPEQIDHGIERSASSRWQSLKVRGVVVSGGQGAAQSLPIEFAGGLEHWIGDRANMGMNTLEVAQDVEMQ